MTKENSVSCMQSFKRAVSLFDSGLINSIPAGTVEGLCQLHTEIFGGMDEEAGIYRTTPVYSEYIRHTNPLFLPKIMPIIDEMPHKTIEEMIAKFVEVMVAYPFKVGSGIVARMWLDLMLKESMHKVVAWSIIPKETLWDSLLNGEIDNMKLRVLLMPALTSKVFDRDIFISNLEQSYTFEFF